SRLRQKLDVNGSPEYELTWSQWDMPWGQPIFRLRASARRTSGNGCGGWPTPRTEDNPDFAIVNRERSGGYSLPTAARFAAGWRTPSGSDGEGGTMDVLMAMREGYTPKLKLRDQAPLVGWATPKASDGTGGRTTATKGGGNVHLDRQARGTMLSGSLAPTERRGVLNPALSLWLMGYPDEWLSCGVRAMQSSRRLQRCS